MTGELSANNTLSHYRIVSKIGAGGMGKVYLAQDTKLDRLVALKILPTDVSANQDRMRRFIQEAKAAAALNHPNIAHIYEIGESDGRKANCQLREIESCDESQHSKMISSVDGAPLIEDRSLADAAT
jgi:serine/threonine protein kinase